MLWTFLFILSYFSLKKEVIFSMEQSHQKWAFFKRMGNPILLRELLSRHGRKQVSVPSVQSCKRFILSPTSWFVHQLLTYWIFFPWNDFPLWPIREKSAGHGMQGKPTWCSGASPALCSWSSGTLGFAAKCFSFLRTTAALASVKFADQWSSKIQTATGSDLFLTAGSLDIRNYVSRGA